MKRLITPFAALICSILSATTAFAGAPATPVPPAGGPIRLLPPPTPMPASGPQVRGQARADFDATNGYSVAVSLCSSDPQSQPMPGDVLSLTIRSASGLVLFGVNVTTDVNGCYTGTLALGVTELPVQLGEIEQQGVGTNIPIAVPS